MKKDIKVSIALNLITVLMVLFAVLLIVFDINFLGEGILLERSSVFEPLKYFTIQSNILMGIISFIFLIYEILFLKKKIKKVPKYIYTLKHMATVGVVLTFCTTVFYLAPFSKYDFFLFFTNSNLFFHLLVPICSLITYVFFEKNNRKFSDVIIGLIPMILYAIFYVTNYILHLDSPNPEKYDWYYFVSGGIISSIISIVVMFSLTFLISYLLMIFSRKRKN